MMSALIHTSFVSLRRDRAALVFAFFIPIAFFSIFAVIFGGQHSSTPRIRVIAVDNDHSKSSAQLLQALRSEPSLVLLESPESPQHGHPVPYTSSAAEAAVMAGDAPVALVIRAGFGEHPILFTKGHSNPDIQLVHDGGDPVPQQMLAGLVQKAAITSMSGAMLKAGISATGTLIGGYTPQQQKRITEQLTGSPGASKEASLDQWGNDEQSLIAISSRPVNSGSRNKPLISFYAAAIGVMFLLFASSNASAALLEEAESGTLDRTLSTRITMPRLLAGKLIYNCLLAFAQLTLMFLWATAVFHVDLLHHLIGFVLMGLSTSFAVASFGILLASVCKTRAQLGALSTFLVLAMSALGGSMFPRYMMPEMMQKFGLFTLNAWSIDGFTKVFWREEPLLSLWPQVSVLVLAGLALFLVALRAARRWEYA